MPEDLDEIKKKYKGIMVRALNKVEDLSDHAGILANSESSKIEHAPDRVAVDADTLQAFLAFHKMLGECIVIMNDARREYDRITLDDEVKDLDIDLWPQTQS